MNRLAIVAALLFASSASAESVSVKYRGSVELAKFSCRGTDSSLVHRICYRANRQYLIAQVGGEYYHYCRMPQVVVNKWLAAPSLGSFYNAQVKGRYDCREGGVPVD